MKTVIGCGLVGIVDADAQRREAGALALGARALTSECVEWTSYCIELPLFLPRSFPRRVHDGSQACLKATACLAAIPCSDLYAVPEVLTRHGIRCWEAAGEHPADRQRRADAVGPYAVQSWVITRHARSRIH
eukprot:366097-Chlamydomonas_euryale.AAC.22